MCVRAILHRPIWSRAGSRWWTIRAHFPDRQSLSKGRNIFNLAPGDLRPDADPDNVQRMIVRFAEVE